MVFFHFLIAFHLMILLVMAVGEWVTPFSESKAKEIRTEAISGGSLFSSDQLVWAKDGEHFVSIGQVLSRDSLQDITIFDFDDTLTLPIKDAEVFFGCPERAFPTKRRLPR